VSAGLIAFWCASAVADVSDLEWIAAISLLSDSGEREFVTMMRQLEGLEFDVMLEAKAKDLALLRLRSDLTRIAPDVAARFGIPATIAPSQVQEITVQTESSESLLDI
jgi:hypothetical protein